MYMLAPQYSDFTPKTKRKRKTAPLSAPPMLSHSRCQRVRDTHTVTALCNLQNRNHDCKQHKTSQSRKQSRIDRLLFIKNSYWEVSKKKFILGYSYIHYYIYKKCVSLQTVYDSLTHRRSRRRSHLHLLARIEVQGL